MASDIILCSILPGQELVVRVDEMQDNFLIVSNKKNDFKGLLFPINLKNDIIFDKLLKECKELYDKDEKRQSLCCIADSTLNHNPLEFNFNNEDNLICVRCKNNIKKVPKVNKKSVSKEVQKLTNHGFNKEMLKMKNHSPRRGTFRGTYRLTSGKMTIKIEKAIKKEDFISSNDISNNMYKRYKSNIKIVSRKMSERALKTKANEKIIDLCTKRKSTKITPSTKSSILEVEEKKSKLCNPIVSSTSVYDFVDDDCESEPFIKSPPLFKIKAKRKQKNCTNINRNIVKQDIDEHSNTDVNYFEQAVKSENITKKRPLFAIKSKCRQKSTTNINQNVNNQDIDVHSNPGVTYYEHNGIKFCLNDVVWAKIPGYPFWPAHIYSFDNVSLSKISGKRCIINWIGWNQQSFLPLKSLLHFKDNFANKYSPKLKSVKYKIAVELACKELKMDFNENIESVKHKQFRNIQSTRKKSINLDEIFNCQGENMKNLLELDINQERCSDDEDTDEEEKARSALITAESIEANSKLSELIMKTD